MSHFLCLKDVEIKFVIGHESRAKSYPLKDRMTHDWVLFVKGDGGKPIEHVVEKVIFKLHPTFQQPRRGNKVL